MLQAPHPCPLGTHVPIPANGFPLRISVMLPEGSVWTQTLFFSCVSISLMLSQSANTLLNTWNLDDG